MSELIRNTVFGHFLRLITRGKVLPYAEDKGPSIWKDYIHHEMTENIAHHGQIGEEAQEDKETRTDPQNSSEDTSRTRAGNNSRTNAVGHMIDLEKGRDASMYGYFPTYS